ncbi:sensor histidine kinase [Pseudoduganella sp. OTU4001]|uniref:sensor histidine kinase n=1 Tax=Pseudoduganella sp. OTU4001 TaxID=3043854 RepID=UPI00313C3CA2
MLNLLRAMLAMVLLPWFTLASAACQGDRQAPVNLHGCMRAIPAPAVVGADASLIWLRIDIEPAMANSYLDIGLPDAFRLQAYQGEEDHWRLAVQLNEQHRVVDRPLQHRRLLVPVTGAGPTTLLVGYRTHGTTPLSPRLLSQEQLLADDTRRNVGNGITFGIMLVMVPLLAVGLGSLRNRSYRIYAVLVASCVLFIAQVEGYWFQFLWPDAPAWNMKVPTLLALTMLISHAAFASSFLQMRWRMPRLYRLNLAVIASGAALMLVQLALPTMTWIMALGSAYTVLAIVGAIEGVRQNVAAARFYLLGVLSLCVSILLLVFSFLWFNPLPGIPVLSYPKYGYLGEAFFFGTAVLSQLRQFNEQQAELRTRRLAETEQLLQAEQAKSLALAQAEQHKLKLASASHDISQPLASLRYAMAALSQQHEHKPIADHIDNTLNYAQTLLKDLIVQCRQEATGPETIRLDELMAQLQQEFAPSAAAKGLRLRVCRPDLALAGSGLLLYRILNNLLANAIRYTPQGQVLLGARRRPGGIELQVWDTGPGIPPATQAALLEPFSQGQTGGAGFGLGLFIVRNLCQQCGYQLRIVSRPGRGSGFLVFIPR